MNLKYVIRVRVNRRRGRPSWVSLTPWDLLAWYWQSLWSLASRSNPLFVLLALGMGISAAQALTWRFWVQ